MTLFLANGTYNGAVTSKSDSDLYDFLNEFVIKDSIGNTVNNLFDMLRELTTAGNYSVEGTVEWYDAARNLLQGNRMWMRGEELFRQITASEGERFQYIQVFLNQAMDVHPPFYYLLVHTVFSLFSGTYSDTYLFAINMIALLLTCIVLWKIAELLSDKWYFPIITVVIYGFSQGFISCAVYFRMYAWFTLFATFTIYLHLLLVKAGYKSEKKFWLFFIATIVFGFYTHYYYIIFLVPIFVLTIIQMLKKHKKAEMLGYIKRCIIAGFISILIWPLSLYHILFGYRGTEAVANLVSEGFISKIGNYYGIIKKAFFLDSNLMMLLFFIIGCLLLAMKIRNKYAEDSQISNIVCFLISSIFYLVVVSQIAPAQSDRYIMCIYPMIALAISGIMMNLICAFKNNMALEKAVVAIMVGVLIICAIFVIHPNYLYMQQKDLVLGTEARLADMNCLVISDGDFRAFPESIKLSSYREVIVLEEQQITTLENQKPTDSSCDMVVYILGGLDQNQNLKQVCDFMDYSENGIEEIVSDMIDFKAYMFQAKAE